MKQHKASAFFIILALILLSLPQPAFADQQWHYLAAAQVAQPGLTETVLPAGVFFGADNAARTSQLCPTLNTRSLLYQTFLVVTMQMMKKMLLYGNRVGRANRERYV